MGSRSPYWLGFRDALTVYPAVAVWAIAYGAAAILAGLSPAAAVLMSLIAWSGAAQVAALGALKQPLWVIFLTSLMLSVRFVPMTLIVGSRLHGHPWWRRALIGSSLVDYSFAMLLVRGSRSPGMYLLGSFSVLYTGWTLGTVVGVVAGRLLPPSAADLADALIAAIFTLLAVQTARGRAGYAVTAAGFVIALALSSFAPASVAMLVGACGAAAAGAALGRR